MPLTNPVASSGDKYISKDIELSTLPIGDTAVLTIVGGSALIKALFVYCTNSATSGGAATLAARWGGASITGVVPLSQITAGKFMRGTLATMTDNVNTSTNLAMIQSSTAADNNSMTILTSNSISPAMGTFALTVGTAVFTGGTMRIECLYQPMTLTAVLS